MGVVVLQGEAQARVIEDFLLEHLGVEEIERRRLVCGNSYSFQGDERDIMFLSMVARRTNESGRSLNQRMRAAALTSPPAVLAISCGCFHLVRSEDRATRAMTTITRVLRGRQSGADRRN